MKFGRMRKKGISPLIATVLLIGFAIGLGAIVMNWGRSYAKEGIERTEFESETKQKCKLDAGLRVYKIDGRKQVCANYTSNPPDAPYLDIMIENGPIVDIDGLHLIMSDSDGNIWVDIIDDSSISRAGVLHLKHPYDEAVIIPDIVQIKISPVIMLNGDELICTEKSLVVEQGEILPC